MVELDQSVLEQILEIGGRMLTSGGEAKRVEIAISRLCRAYGAASSDVFVITSSIVVTARFRDREPITQTRRITGNAYNLNELNALNTLSREVCENPLPAKELEERIRNAKIVRIPLPVKVLCWAIVSAGFSVFFGGSMLDGIFSALIGMVLCLLKTACMALSMENYFSIIICSVIGGLLSALPEFFGFEVSQFYISIGNIMLFIPGIGLTNSIRDMFSGDTITGLLRFIEAIIVSMVVACGFAAFDVLSAVNDTPNWWLQLITAFLGSLGFGFVFNARPKNTLIGAFGGLGGWATVLVCVELWGSEILGYFIASALITLAAEILARVLHCPTTLFIVIAILPLVPGKSLYITMQYATEGLWEKFASQGITTLLYAIAISAGIMLMTAVFGMFMRLKSKIT